MNKKHIAIGLFAVIALAGCTMEEQTVNEDVLSGKQLTIEASREAFGSEGGSPETRTIRDEASKSVLWVPGDAISLFYGSGADGGSKFTSTLESGSSEMTNFTGTITAITGGGELTVDDTYFWGVYPYGEDVSCDGQGVTMTVPTAQLAMAGTFAPNTFPSVGRSQGLIMGFYNICGGWRFSVTKEGVRRVTLKSNAGEQITGKVKVKLDDAGIPMIEEILEGSDEVVLEAPAGKYFEVGKNYYMILLPTVFESGFTMTFETFTEEGEYNRTKKTTISRSKFSGIDKLDTYLTTPYAKKTGPIPVEDANFKAYLVENFDTDGDSEISYEEALEITAINVCTDDIESVQGIEYMAGLQSLSCFGSSNVWSSELQRYVSLGKLTSLDVSANTKLEWLDCEYNQLPSLDVSSNTALTQLLCYDNQLTSLNVSANTALTNLYCNNNQLTSLDVSNNPALTTLHCSSNQLTSLDVSNNPALTRLHCPSNKLTSLDVSKNTALTGLYCSSNQLTSLDVSANTELTVLYCGDNQLTSLDVSANTALTVLYCAGNQLTSLNVSANTALTRLYCNNNQLTSLVVSKNTALNDLDCSPMSDASGNNLLSVLYIAQGQEIPSVTTDRNEDNIPSETEIVVVGEQIMNVNLSLSQGYFLEYWTNPSDRGEEGLSTRYNVMPAPAGSTIGRDAQMITDINTSFETYGYGHAKAGKLKVNGVDNVVYYFCKADMEKITKIGDLNVNFVVANSQMDIEDAELTGYGFDGSVDEGEFSVLFGSILGADGKAIKGYELQPVAIIVNGDDKAMSTAEYILADTDLQVNFHNTFIWLKQDCMNTDIVTGLDETHVADTLINTGAMYTFISATAMLCTEDEKEIDVTFEGKDHFQADILRPIEVASVAADKYIDGVDFGQKGSYISIEDLVSPTDWRKRTFVDYPNYWGYYGVDTDGDEVYNFEVTIDTDATKMRRLGKTEPEDLKAGMYIVHVKPDAETETVDKVEYFKVPDPIRPSRQVLIPKNESGYLMYFNNGRNLTEKIYLVVTAKLHYGFGYFTPDPVEVLVETTEG